MGAFADVSHLGLSSGYNYDAQQYNLNVPIIPQDVPQAISEETVNRDYLPPVENPPLSEQQYSAVNAPAFPQFMELIEQAQQPQYTAPSASQYSAPSAPQHSAPSSPQYSAPSAPQYSTPNAPQYSAPSAPQYSAPSVPQYSAPSASQYSAPSAPQYSAPSTPQYSASSVPQYSAPSAPQYQPIVPISAPLEHHQHEVLVVPQVVPQVSPTRDYLPPAEPESLQIAVSNPAPVFEAVNNEYSTPIQETYSAPASETGGYHYNVPAKRFRF